jgi:mRNA deadenylase 3'-5' endonuclease subunit Ccr4
VPEQYTHLFETGSLTHSFGMRSVYKNVGDKEVTTKQQNGWVVVDYMFYSTNFCEKYNKFIEGNLKLVAKLDLLSGHQCRRMGSLPSEKCPSDHLSLCAKFLLCSKRSK